MLAWKVRGLEWDSQLKLNFFLEIMEDRIEKNNALNLRVVEISPVEKVKKTTKF